uniref:PurM-like C-terminal domain-containing protein n=1 Tax=Ciona savignyi TaxID=51511 RepID=H2Y9L2_CIOSA
LSLFVRGWKTTQQIIRGGLVTAGHDVSDGGFITALLEMGFAGNCGLEIDITSPDPMLGFMFSERLGLILECNDPGVVVGKYLDNNVGAVVIGASVGGREVTMRYNGDIIMNKQSIASLRATWEATSFALERLQCQESCVESEEKWCLECESDPQWNANFEMIPPTIQDGGEMSGYIHVAILREEGSNGDREMATAFYLAGFQTWDVTMQDLVSSDLTLDRFRGLVFGGGFSYADVGGDKGTVNCWAACCKYNSTARTQLHQFRSRPDTFSLGVCNGCQLMALLGWL